MKYDPLLSFISLQLIFDRHFPSNQIGSILSGATTTKDSYLSRRQLIQAMYCGASLVWEVRSGSRIPTVVFVKWLEDRW
jgi:hypothetical protein